MKCRVFGTPNELVDFVTAESIAQEDIVTILCDNSGKFVLFYYVP